MLFKKNYLLILVFLLALTVASAFFIKFNSTVSLQTVNPSPASEFKSLPSSDFNSGKLEPIDWEGLDAEIKKIIGNESKDYGYVVKDLATGELISHRGDQIYYPASIYKIPLAILTLQQIEADPEYNLDTKILITKQDYAYPIDPLAGKIGQELTADEILNKMLRESDNVAMRLFERKLGGHDVTHQKIKDTFAVERFLRRPQEVTPLEVATVFEGIYNQKYLTAEYNDYLLEHMENVVIWQRDRLPAGLPEGTKIAHKIGTLETTYQDAGIVYHQHRDYLIVVLNRQIDPAVARIKIQKISAATYEYVITRTKE